MHKLTTSAKGSDGLSIGFDRDCGRRQRELTNNKNLKGENHVRIMRWDIFGFAEHQEKATYGMVYKLTLTRIKDEAILQEAVGVADAKIEIDHIHWCIPHYKPSIQQQGLLSKQILRKIPTELKDIERYVFMKEMIN